MNLPSKLKPHIFYDRGIYIKLEEGLIRVRFIVIHEKFRRLSHFEIKAYFEPVDDDFILSPELQQQLLFFCRPIVDSYLSKYFDKIKCIRADCEIFYVSKLEAVNQPGPLTIINTPPVLLVNNNIKALVTAPITALVKIPVTNAPSNITTDAPSHNDLNDTVIKTTKTITTPTSNTITTPTPNTFPDTHDTFIP